MPNTLIDAIATARTQPELAEIEAELALGNIYETYAETAERLMLAGDDYHAEAYDALEARWFQLEES